MFRGIPQRVMQAWFNVESFAITTLTIASMVVASYAMASRYFAPEHSLDWADEMVVYLITWAIWLAGARAVLGAGHVKSDFFVHKLPAKWRRRIEHLQDFGSCLFCLTVMVGGIQVVQLAVHFGERSDSSLAMPLWIYYLCLPLGLASISARYVERLLCRAHRT